jgi:hypothetical protein
MEYSKQSVTNKKKDEHYTFVRPRRAVFVTEYIANPCPAGV